VISAAGSSAANASRVTATGSPSGRSMSTGSVSLSTTSVRPRATEPCRIAEEHRAAVIGEAAHARARRPARQRTQVDREDAQLADDRPPGDRVHDQVQQRVAPLASEQSCAEQRDSADDGDVQHDEQSCYQQPVLEAGPQPRPMTGGQAGGQRDDEGPAGRVRRTAGRRRTPRKRSKSRIAVGLPML